MSRKPLHKAGIHAVILAAGKGKRMKSDIPKVLHEIGETPLVIHVLTAAIESGVSRITVVVGHGKEAVIETVQKWAKGIEDEVEIDFAEQDQQKGTGHAVLCAEPSIDSAVKFVMVLLGDVPLLQSETLVAAYHKLLDADAHSVVITTELEDATGYGRIVKENEDFVATIVEEKDANDTQRAIREINTGIFLFTAKDLFEIIREIGSENAQGEYYLTDMVKLLNEKNLKVTALSILEPMQFMGVNSPEDLAHLAKLHVPVKRVAK